MILQTNKERKGPLWSEFFLFTCVGLILRKNPCLTGEFHGKFPAKNRYRTNREVFFKISRMSKSISESTVKIQRMGITLKLETIAVLFKSRRHSSWRHSSHVNFDSCSICTEQKLFRMAFGFRKVKIKRSKFIPAYASAISLARPLIPR